MSYYVKSITGGDDIDNILPPFDINNANDYLQVNSNGTDTQWVDHTTYQTISLQDGNVSNPPLNFSSNVDCGLYKSGTSEISVGIDGVQEIAINPTNTIIRNDLLLNNNGVFFESDTDTGIRRSNPNNIAIRTNGTDKINVGDAITSLSNLCDFNSIIRESNYFQALNETTPTLTISTVRQYRVISCEISALSATNGLIDFDIDIANGEWYILQVYNNTTNQGRICNIRFNNGCFNLTTMGIVTANTNIQIHAQNNSQSFSSWLVFRHNGTLLHLQRLSQKNQDMQIETLNINTPIYWNRLSLSANYTIGTNESYNFYSCNCTTAGFTITLPNWTSVADNGRTIYIHKQEFTGNLLTIAVPSGASLGDRTDGTFTITNSGSIFACVYNRVSNSSRWTIIKLGSPATIQLNDLQFLMPYTNNTTTPSLSFRANTATSTEHGKSGVNLHTDETSLNLITNNATRLRVGALETELLNTRMIFPQGSVSTPSIVFSSEPTNSRNTGLYSTGDNIINFSANSTNVLQINQTNIDAKVPVQFSGSSTNTAPAFYNGGSITTGLYFESNLNNDVSLTCAGTLCLQVTQDFISDNLNHFKLNKAPVNVWLSENTDKTWTWSEMLTRFPLYVFDTSGGLRTLTLPSQTSNTTYIGLTIKIYKIGANNLDIKGAAGVYLNGTLAGTHTISTNRQLHYIVYTGDTSSSSLGWHVLS